MKEGSKPASRERGGTNGERRVANGEQRIGQQAFFYSPFAIRKGGDMHRATRPPTAGEDRKLDAAERQAAADFLRLAHDTSELWRRCARKRCRRRRTCAGELDDCGARAFP